MTPLLERVARWFGIEPEEVPTRLKSDDAARAFLVSRRSLLLGALAVPIARKVIVAPAPRSLTAIERLIAAPIASPGSRVIVMHPDTYKALLGALDEKGSPAAELVGLVTDKYAPKGAVFATNRFPMKLRNGGRLRRKVLDVIPFAKADGPPQWLQNDAGVWLGVNREPA